MSAEKTTDQNNSKKLIAAVVLLVIVVGIVIAILVLLTSGEETPDPRYFQKASCLKENPSPIERNACLKANCTFVSSVCDAPCPFDYKTDDKGCQSSCECAESGLYQGDIMFEPSQIQGMSELYGLVDKNDFDVFYGSVTSYIKLWKNKVNGRYKIGYTMIDEIANDQHKFSQITKVVKMISESTCIDFVPRTNEQHYIQFVMDPARGCASLVGRAAHQTPQTVSLDWGCYPTSTIHHELKHLLGFNHEHVRADRDAYLTVMLDNVMDGQQHNFKKISKDMVVKSGVPYDITSVMQYSSTAFTKNPTTFSVLERGTDRVIEFINGPYTEYDAYEINNLYECLDDIPSAKWAAWVEWTECDETCGSGERYKYRRCEDSEGKQVSGCRGEPMQTERCDETPCPPSTAAWLEWQPWKPCKTEQGYSYRIRDRKCSEYMKCEEGTWREYQECTDDILTQEKIEKWGPWEECSKSCDGERKRIKMCHGSPCPNANPEYGSCNTDCHRPGAGAGPGGGGAASVGEWGQWSPCTATCDGTRARKKLCNGYICGGIPADTEECNIGRCGAAVDWKWSHWLDCSATCEGVRKRVKICGNTLCSDEENAITEGCNTDPCPGVGGYTTTTTTAPNAGGEWGLWSSCSATCDGTRVRC